MPFNQHKCNTSHLRGPNLSQALAPGRTLIHGCQPRARPEGSNACRRIAPPNPNLKEADNRRQSVQKQRRASAEHSGSWSADCGMETAVPQPKVQVLRNLQDSHTHDSTASSANRNELVPVTQRWNLATPYASRSVSAPATHERQGLQTPTRTASART